MSRPTCDAAPSTSRTPEEVDSGFRRHGPAGTHLRCAGDPDVSRDPPLPIDATADAGSSLVGVYLPRLWPAMFGARGIAPVGSAAFALVLGVAIGILVRRTLPAMALTLAVFLAVQIAMPLEVRPALVHHERLTATISAANFRNFDGRGLNVFIDEPGAWITDQQTVDAAGRPAGVPPWLDRCLGSGPGTLDLSCLDKLGDAGYRQLVSYQPAGRFWTFQWYELGLYLTLTMLLGAFCVWWIRNRVS